MKIDVNTLRCAGIGICESIAPDVFEVDDNGSMNVIGDEVSPEDLADIQRAIDSCPTAALRLIP
ncbi:ferredoxin [Mycolicibacterium phocaicum]|uniref:ferredoxin n=1 Tax=Mycolicibacterium phocaicum TaxID=319706 RepID=UPI001F40AEEC|nr:ferredoxin [Mycolicibacterium phocaicum]